MQTVGLSWQHSVELAAVLAGTGIGLSYASPPRLRAAAAFARETAVIGLLYGMWVYAGSIAVNDVGGAMRRAHWIRNFEHDVGLPFEGSVQHLVLHHRHVLEAANLYYAAMHMTTMFAFLIWLFVRHREHYKPVRQIMAWSSLVCLIIQFTPVAPPRFLPGVVDTGTVLNQSVYNSQHIEFDQYAAMPSVHVAWAVIVGYYVWRVSPSRWRWIAPIHATVMVFVVVVTGNHWWLDGIVASLIVVTTTWVLFGVRFAWRVSRQRGAAGALPAVAGQAPLVAAASVPTQLEGVDGLVDSA